MSRLLCFLSLPLGGGGGYGRDQKKHVIDQPRYGTFADMMEMFQETDRKYHRKKVNDEKVTKQRKARERCLEESVNLELE